MNQVKINNTNIETKDGKKKSVLSNKAQPGIVFAIEA